MVIFANKPTGNTKVTCKYCGNTCCLGKIGNFCSRCGKAITSLPNKKRFKNGDFTDLYNYYYNSKTDIFSDQSKRLFEFYINNIYSQVEVDTIPIINSSLRSGYSIGLAEEKIYNKKLQPYTNIDLILKKAHKDILKTDMKVGTLNKSDANLLAFAVYLAIDYKYEKFCFDKKIIDDNLVPIIDDNIDYLIPQLSNVYTGKTVMETVGGIFPHIFSKPITFDKVLREMWTGYISNDTVIGYCTKLAESYL